MLPGPGHGRNAKGGVHGGGAVELAGEAIAQAEIACRRGADQMGEGGDLLDGEAGYGGRPFGRPLHQMCLEFRAEIGVAGHISAVGQPVAEQHMHGGDGQRPVGARPQDEAHIGLFHGGRAVNVDDHDPGPALLAGAHGVGHHVDLGMHRIGAPDDHAVALGHLLWIDAAEQAGAGDIARPGSADADGLVLPRIALGGAQAPQPVALHMAHGACIEIGPDGFWTVLGLDMGEAGGDLVQRLVPGNGGELAAALGAAAAQRAGQPLGMVHALGIAGDLFADDAGRIGVILGAAHPADGMGINDVHVQGAGRGAVMRADRARGAEDGGTVHDAANLSERGAALK